MRLELKHKISRELFGTLKSNKSHKYNRYLYYFNNQERLEYKVTKENLLKMVTIEEIQQQYAVVKAKPQYKDQIWKFDNIIIGGSHPGDPIRLLDPATGGEACVITKLNTSSFETDGYGPMDTITFIKWCEWRIAELNYNDITESIKKDEEEGKQNMFKYFKQNSLQSTRDKAETNFNIVQNRFEETRRRIQDQIELRNELTQATNQQIQALKNEISDALTKATQEYDTTVNNRIVMSQQQAEEKIFTFINQQQYVSEESFKQYAKKYQCLIEDQDKLYNEADTAKIHLEEIDQSLKRINISIGKLKENAAKDFEESKNLIIQEAKKQQSEWTKEIENQRLLLVAMMPKDNQKDLTELNQKICDLALQLATLKVSKNDIDEKKSSKSSRAEKIVATKLSNELSGLNRTILDATTSLSAGMQQTNGLIMQMIEDISSKLASSIKEVSLPITQHDETTYYNQIVFSLLNKYPKAKEEFRLIRNDQNQLVFQPKAGKEQQCKNIINTFIHEYYNSTMEEIKDITQGEWEIITISKYKSSSSPPSTTVTPTQQKFNNFKPFKIAEHYGTTKPSTSQAPPQESPFTEYVREQQTIRNTQGNAARSAQGFEDMASYRNYKVKSANLKEAIAFLNSNKTNANLTEVPQPFLAQGPEVPKKSPLDGFNLKCPVFSGKKNQATSYLKSFIDYVNHYYVIPDQADLITCFINTQTDTKIKDYLSTEFSYNPNMDFQRMSELFLQKYGSFTIQEHLNFWNNFHIIQQNPEDSKRRIEQSCEALKFSKLQLSLKVFTSLPINWRKDIMLKNLLPTESNDHYEDIWLYINETLANEQIIRETEEMAAALSGGVVRRRNSFNKKKKNDKTIERPENNKRGYKAYKKDNKYKKSHHMEVIEEKPLSEEEILKEINEELTSHQTIMGTRTISLPNAYSYMMAQTEQESPYEEFQRIKQKKQEQINKAQEECALSEIKYTKAFIPMPNERQDKVLNNDEGLRDWGDAQETGLLNAFVLIDTGSNVNMISKKLANILEVKTYKNTSNIKVTGGKIQTDEATVISLAIIHKNGQEVFILKNLPFIITKGPDYLLAVGMNIERKYGIKINDIMEIETNPTLLLRGSNNRIEENLNVISEAMKPGNNPQEENERVPLPNERILSARINQTPNLETMEPTTIQIYPQNSQSHHNILQEYGIKGTHYTRKGYTVSINNNKAQEENEKNIKKMLPPELGEYNDVFSIPSGLPPSRGKWDFKVEISQQDLDQLPCKKPKEIGKEAMKATKEMINQYLKDGWISEVPNSDNAVDMFPVPKKDKSYRYVYNYVPVNKVCHINQNPLPNLRNNVDILAANPYRIALDLRNAYNQIRITDKKTKQATRFITPFGIYEWNVMPFGLSDAPPFFQAYINHVLNEKLNNGVCAYLDDILVYGKTKTECLDNCKWVLEQFRKEKLYCKIEKCEFFPKTVTYLGFAVKQGSYVPLNMERLDNLKKPNSLKELQKVLGVINWFSDSIPRKAEILNPLMECLSNYDQNIIDKNFHKCIKQLEFYPRFPFDYDSEYFLISDASEVSGSSILFQTFPGGSNAFLKALYESNNAWNLVEEWIKKDQLKALTCYSHKFNNTEINYSAFDKELLSIILGIEHNSYFLQNNNKPIMIITDNIASAKILEGQSQKVVDSRRMRYLERLQGYRLRPFYLKGTKNEILDWFSRQPIKNN